MIVREILDNPDLASSFNFFNDYKDTLYWLKSLRHVPEAESVIIRLKDAYFAHLNQTWP